jgi:hypothetical protein
LPEECCAIEDKLMSAAKKEYATVLNAIEKSCETRPEKYPSDLVTDGHQLI